MRKISLEEKFILQLTDIDGDRIPCTNSIISIWNELKDDKAKELFCLVNNENAEIFDCFYNPEDYIAIVTDPKMKSILELRIKLMQIFKRQSEILDIDINCSMIWRSQAVIEWFDYMRGNTRGADVQRLRKRFSKLYRIKIGKSSPDGFSMSRVKDNLILEKYSEYLVAKDIFDIFSSTATVIAQVNTEVNDLLISITDIAKQVAALVVETKDQEYLFECPFCKDLIIVLQGKALAHCKSPKCKKAYFTKQKQIHNNNPKKGWVEDPTVQPNACVGGCGSKRRKLNSDLLCHKCYPEDDL
jgi:hypothetical protein